MRADLHSHTFYSLLPFYNPLIKGNIYFQDSCLSPKILVKIAKKKGLDAIALTDHDNGKGLKEFAHYAKKNKIQPILGQEVTLFKVVPYEKKGNRKRYIPWAHVLVWGTHHVPWKIRFQPVDEFLDALNDLSVPFALSHPFDVTKSAPGPGYDPKTYKINKELLDKFILLDGHNGFQPYKNNYITQIIAREFGYPMIGGSDSHEPIMVGRCFTEVPDAHTVDDFLEALFYARKNPKNTKVKAYGLGATPITWERWIRCLVKQLDWNTRFDIYRHFNPNIQVREENWRKDPVYDALFFQKMPIAVKILLRAELRYLLPLLTIGLKIYGPLMLKKANKKYIKIYDSLLEEIGKREFARTKKKIIDLFSK